MVVFRRGVGGFEVGVGDEGLFFSGVFYGRSRDMSRNGYKLKVNIFRWVILFFGDRNKVLFLYSTVIYGGVGGRGLFEDEDGMF